MATTAYNAGVDTSDLIVIVNKESVWGTLVDDANAKKVRLLSESLSESKTRNRPAEINADGYAAQGITTQVQAAGDLSFALSAGTFDDLLEGALNGAWTTAASNTGVDGATTKATSTFTGTGIATDVVVGQWVEISGFTEPAFNGFHRIATRADADTFTVDTDLSGAAGADETGVSFTVAAPGMLRNGTAFQSYSIEKSFGTSANLFLRYLGCYVSSMSLSASVGDFVQGSFSMLAKSETKDTSSAFASEINAPTGRVIDTVAGFLDLSLDGVALTTAGDGAAQSLDFTVTKNNARAQYGIGSAAALGMGRGTIQVDGSLSMYFKSFTLYDKYANETDVRISFRLQDGAGDGYIVTLPQVTLMNPAIQAGGPDTDVIAAFQMEASQDAASGCTIQIDKIT